MAAITDHPVFSQPSDPNATIWRYFTIEKYLHFITSKSLFLSRVDLLGDPFEGSLNKFTWEALEKAEEIDPTLAPDGTAVNFLPSLRTAFRNARFGTYVNCWHMNNFESEAMWRLYGRDSQAIALRCKYSELARNLSKECFIGCVSYKDYGKEIIPSGNIFYPALHKRASFDFEREIRIVRMLEGWAEPSFDANKAPKGLLEVLDFNTFDFDILVSPLAPDWYIEMLHEISEKFGVDKRISSSSLAEDPVF